jgi:hypothetical protein
MLSFKYFGHEKCGNKLALIWKYNPQSIVDLEDLLNYEHVLQLIFKFDLLLSSPNERKKNQR